MPAGALWPGARFGCRAGARAYGCALLWLLLVVAPARAQEEIPELTRPVNDFAGVIDPESERALERIIRSLQQASGDVIVIATVPTFKPYGDINEYAVKMFENHGRGIGQQGRDNGLLVLLAVADRRVRVEVGYDLEEFITDGFAGETSRQFMAPEFRQGEYGRGLLAGVARIADRIADRRRVSLDGVSPPPPPARRRTGFSTGAVVGLFLLVLLLNGLGRSRRVRRGGWHSGVGPFGGGFGGGIGGLGGGGFGRGGFGGGGFGGGFGGFGGGRSGGGGGGAGW